MNCSACGHTNRDSARFCEACASPLAASCVQCGNELRVGARFCDGCAHPVDPSAAQPEAGGAAAAAQRPPERSPRDYTPKHLADKILQSKSALEGERKQVTVMFADVKGSMELAEQLGPEEWHRILDRFFEILAEGVHRFEGTVNQYTGDGIMALFGAPIAHEDHAERACYAALALRDEVRGYANEVRSQHGVPFGVRIGLNSGEVVVGRIGDDLRMDYTAQGHVVGLAQRMEALAESGHICLSEHTAKRVTGYFELLDLGRAKVKGVEEPIGLFDLERVGAFRTRLDRSRARGLSTFVGRDRDMATLEAALERARAGTAQVVGIMADAGTGKSRLCAEFLDGCRAQGIPIYEGRGVAHGKSIPMLPILEHWRAFYGIGESDDAETTRSKIAGRLLLMDDAFREVLPVVFDLFGVSDPANPAPAMDADQRQRHLHGVVRQILHDPGYRGTRVHLLEDLHWFDGASDSFLATMIESWPATNDLILVNFRPEYQAPWMQRSYYEHLRLQPLGADAIRALLRDQLGEHASVSGLPEMIHERTKGNPFFIEEVVQTLVESGHLAGTRGAYRLTTAIDALEVPASVQAVLAARIDRLPERDKQLLQTAAVIGKTFAEPLLRQVVSSVSKLDESELGQALSSLVAAEFLFEASLYPQLEYSFKHPLTQEVAQGSQLREQRVRVHAAVALALEAVGGNQDERAAEIAQHWEEAEDAERAARWYRRAAEWAGLSDPAEGLRHWGRVRVLAPGLSDERERDEVMLRTCVQLFTLGWRIGGSEEDAASIFETGCALARSSEDRPSLARLVGFYGLMRAQNTGSALDYVRYGEEAGEIAAECDDPALRAGIWTLPAFGYFYVGDGLAAMKWADRVLEEAGEDNELGRDVAGYAPRAAMTFCRAKALIDLGRFEEAERAIEDAVRISEEAKALEILSWSLWAWAGLAYARGGPEPMFEQSGRCIEIAEQLDLPSDHVVAQWTIGNSYLIDGQAAAARDSYRAAETIMRERAVQLGWLPGMLAKRAEAHLALGESAEALIAAREAIEVGAAGGNRYDEAVAQLMLVQGLLVSEGGVPRPEIEFALARTEELVRLTSAGSLAPRVLETRGRVASALGDEAEANRLLKEAHELFQEIGATGHAARLARELGV